MIGQAACVKYFEAKESEDMNARVLVVQFNGFMSLTSYFDVKYGY